MMASSGSAHENEPGNSQESVLLAQRQPKPVVPVIPRELEKKHGRNINKKSPSPPKTELPTKLADEKVKEPSAGKTHQPSKEVGARGRKLRSSGAFAVQEIPPFKPKNSLKQASELYHASRDGSQSSAHAEGMIILYRQGFEPTCFQHTNTPFGSTTIVSWPHLIPPPMIQAHKSKSHWR